MEGPAPQAYRKLAHVEAGVPEPHVTLEVANARRADSGLHLLPRFALTMDVHKDRVMVAVLPETTEKATQSKKLPNNERALRRSLARAAKDGELHGCYEASDAGYVLQRAMERWRHAREVIAPAASFPGPAMPLVDLCGTIRGSYRVDPLQNVPG